MFEVDKAAYSFDLLMEWLRGTVEEPLARNVAADHYLLMHPKIPFLKNLPRGETIFDVGAGEGSLINFKEWLGFKRPDLKFVGASLKHGKHTEQYDEFFVGNLDVQKPVFKNPPSHVFSSGCIEHLGDPDSMLEWVGSILPSGGSIYLDWPAPHTVDLPSLALFKKEGFNMTTINFYDDSTHVTAYPIEDIAERLERFGFRVKTAGLVDLPFLADSLKHHGALENDLYLLSMAMWLKTRFTAFITAEKI